MNFSCGSSVWCQDDTQGFVLANVLEHVSDQEVRLIIENHERSVPISMLECPGANNRPLSDIGMLETLNDATILNNLRLRYERDEIFSKIGPTLVSINPYKITKQDLDEKEPGIFQMSRSILRDLIQQRKSISVIVSGESGSGKTEAVKQLLRNLTMDLQDPLSVDKSNTESTPQEILQNRIVQVGSILEAFGNAKTVRNDNSSRFGKWIDIEFEFGSGQIISGMIQNYLLEKSRLLRLGHSERNFHIFYQVLTDKSICTQFGLCSDPSTYRMLGECSTVDAIDDTQSFKELQAAMDIIEMNADDKCFLYSCIVSILLLGNVDFEENEDLCEVANSSKSLVHSACKWLSIDSEDFMFSLTHCKICKIDKNKSKSEAINSLHAFIKSVYGGLFAWVTERINQSLDILGNNIEFAYDALAETGNIGVLDAFGFEIFENNSFEQLCINYCNEKMQLHFNRLVFESELEEYATEGIFSVFEIENLSLHNKQKKSSIDECLALLEGGRGMGVFALIDDELKLPNGSDNGLLQKLRVKHPNSKCFLSSPKAKKDDGMFHIMHYAGKVTYSTSGFLAKSSDPIPRELQQVCMQSSNSNVQQLFGAVSDSVRVKSSLGTKFKEQLAELCTLIFEESSPHFIRCIKPNTVAQPHVWEGSKVLEQIRYAGLLEASKVRKEGYAIRHSYYEFIQKYSGILDFETSVKVQLAELNYGIEIMCNFLLSCGFLHPDGFRIGNSKIFIKDDQYSKLMELLEESCMIHAVTIQRVFRGFCRRSAIRSLEGLGSVLEQAIYGGEEDELIDSLKRMETQLHKMGMHSHTLLKEAGLKLEEFENCKVIESKIEQAIRRKDWSEFSVQYSRACNSKLMKRSKMVREGQKVVSLSLLVCSELASLLPRQQEMVRKMEPDASQRECLKTRYWLQQVKDLRQCVRVLDQKRNHGVTISFLGSNITMLDPQIAYMGKVRQITRACDMMEHHTCATIIQRFFNTKLHKRNLLLQLRILVDTLHEAIRTRNYTALKVVLCKFDKLGFGEQSSTPHPMVFEASSTLVDIKLTVLGCKNQLEHVTYRVTGTIEGESNMENNKRTKKKPFFKRRLFSKAKKNPRQSDAEDLNEAINKARECGLPENCKTMINALKVLSRVEGSLMNKKPRLLSFASLGNILKNDKGKEKQANGEVDALIIHGDLIDDHLILSDEEEDFASNSSRSSSDSSQRTPLCLAPLQIEEDDPIYMPNDLRNHGRSISASLERTLLERVGREKEMVKVIESRCWEDRRAVRFAKPCSFASLDEEWPKKCPSDKSDVTEKFDCPKKSKRFSCGSVSSDTSTLTNYSTAAYKVHWEHVSFVNRYVVNTKTF